MVVVGVILLVGGLVLGVRWLANSAQEGDERAILQRYMRQVAPLRAPYGAFERRLVRLLRQASTAEEPKTFVAPGVGTDFFHGHEGLYLRLGPRALPITAESVRKAALNMRGDALTRCLGIAPYSARGLFLAESFLSEAWLGKTRALSAPDLKVRKRELDVVIQRDVPALRSVLGARYLLVAMQRGEKLNAHGVDVFAWDLKAKDQPLLRVHTKPKGKLISAAILIEGKRLAATTDRTRHEAIAHDCSIAAQVKEAFGEEVITDRP